MKIETVELKFDDLFYAIAGIAEDNDLQTVDDLCDFLEQNPDNVFNINKCVRGGDND